MGAITMTEVGALPGRFLHADVETMPRERLAALQLSRLNATIANAYANVPLHRKRLDAAGVGANGVESLADVARLAFTTKADLRDNYPFGLFARDRPSLARRCGPPGDGKLRLSGWIRVGGQADVVDLIGTGHRR